MTVAKSCQSGKKMLKFGKIAKRYQKLPKSAKSDHLRPKLPVKYPYEDKIVTCFGKQNLRFHGFIAYNRSWLISVHPRVAICQQVSWFHGLCIHALHLCRGGTIETKIDFLKVFKWILLSFQYIRTGKKEFLNLVTVLTLHIDPQNLKIPIIGSKIKVVADLSSDLSKLVREGH